MKKKIQLVLLTTSFLLAMIGSSAYAAGELWTQATVTIKISKSVYTKYKLNKGSSVTIYLPCVSGQIMTPSTAQCPSAGKFAYTINQVSGPTSKSPYYTYKRAIARGTDPALPAEGWIAEATKTTTVNETDNTYINRVSLPSLTSNPTAKLEVETGMGSIGGYRLFPDLSCPDDTLALSCWIDRVWKFSQVAILTLSIAAFVVAGVIYMTSAGNPKRVESAKKIMLGALSAIAVIVIGKFFLTNIVGIPLK